MKKMGALTGNVRTAVELLTVSQDACQAIFSTLSPAMFGQCEDNTNSILNCTI